MTLDSTLDLVLDGKGRRKWVVIPNEIVTSAKGIGVTGVTQAYSQYGFVDNRSTGSQDAEIRVDERLGEDITYQFKVADVVKSLPYSFSVPANSKMEFEVGWSIAATPAGAGFVEFYLQQDNVTIDSGKLIILIQFVSVADVHKEIELFSTSEQLFPTGATYSADDSIQAMIDEETENFLHLTLDKLEETSLRFKEVAKSYIIKKICYRLLMKACVYTIGGEAIYLKLAQEYKIESERLADRILVGYL